MTAARDGATAYEQPQPLQGYRVLEMTEVWAGPFGTSLLGDLGAEVIRIESFPRAAMTRPVAGPFLNARIVAEPDAPRPWDRAPSYHVANRNKLAIALNALHPRGREILLGLIARSDVFVIGYSAGTAQRMGLDYESLCEIQPCLVMVSMPGWGEAGPYKGYATLGSGLDAFTGHMYLRSYPDLGPAASSGIFHSDATGALALAFAIMTALHYRERSGQGQFIDLSQAEVLLSHLATPIAEWTLNGRVQQPTGNSELAAAPHGCYPCRGEDSWVTIAVRSEEQWRCLVGAMTRSGADPALAIDRRFAGNADRVAHRAELDVLIGAWTAGKTSREVFGLLAPAGVPCGPVYTAGELLADRHLSERGFFHRVEYPLMQPYERPGPVWRLPKTPSSVRREANLLGEHNRAVLAGILGLDDQAIAALEAEGVIGDAYSAASERD